jgi:hypothetical protein
MRMCQRYGWLALSGCLSATCLAQVPSPAFDPAREQADILRTLEQEADCYYAGDYDCWQSYWIQDSTVASFTAVEGTVRSRSSWPAHSEGAKKDIQNREGFYASKVRQENHRFIFMAPTAVIVYFDAYHYVEKDACTYARETRALEKREGRWKLVLSATLYDAQRGCGG